MHNDTTNAERNPKRLCALFAASLFLLLFHLGAGQSLAAEAPSSKAPAYSAKQKEFMDRLDALMSQQDYLHLTQTLAGAAGGKNTGEPDGALITAGLDWARARTLDGAGLAVPAIYSALLWRTADLNSDYGHLRQTSAAMALYALLVVLADGPKCADKTAPEHHMNTILQQYRRQFDELAKLPAQQRQKIADLAIQLEARLAPKRQNDMYLCRYGLQEHRDMAEKLGDKAYVEVPAKPGQIGRQMELQSELDYTPQFKPREVWEPEQAAARAKFPELVAAICKTEPGKETQTDTASGVKHTQP